MADYSFIANPQQQDSFKTIGNLMNVATQAQQLKNSQQDYQRGGVALSKEQQTLQPAVDTAVANAQTAQTGAQSAKLRLAGDQMKTVLDNLGGLVQDPSFVNGDSQGQVKALMDAEDRMVASGVPREVARTGTAPLYVAAQHQPNTTRQLATNLIQVGLGSQGQANQNLVPAGQQQQPGGTDIRGNPTMTVRDQFGGASQAPLPVAQAAPGGAGGPMRFPAGENAQTAQPLYQLREQAQASAAAAPAQHFNNQQIMTLAPSAFTGAGSGQLSKILGSVGLQSTNDVSADTAQLRHFIALQVENNAASQGANTDAARQLAAQAVLPNDSPEKAIKSITKINDAYISGNELFNQGIQATLKSPNNQRDIFALRDYQNAWSQNMDPRIFLLENAAKSGDKAEVEKIKRDLGPEGVKALLQKANVLRTLATQGVE